MSYWFLFALGSALGFSIYHAISKSLSLKISKAEITFWSFFFASIILLSISFFNGLPELGDQFLKAVLITSILNIIAFPILLQAYRLADFSAVFSMFLLTPLFMLLTSYLILKEIPSLLGVVGMIILLSGLFIIIQGSRAESKINGTNYKKGIYLGLLVSFIFSICVNFDKMAVLNSDFIFAGGTIAGLIALGTLPFLIYFQRKTRLNIKNIEKKTILLMLAMVITFCFTSIFHNLALISGLASYTIAIKRTSIIFGVIWGLIFFKEKRFLPKLIGSVIAALGVIVILLS
ncbi:MAG: DMT family transporter [Patescibacteria group bacterium]